MHALKFKQMFTQGIYEKDSPLLQLPHFDTEVLKKLGQKRAQLKLQGKNDLHSFIRLPIETIRQFDLYDGDKEKQLDLEAVCRFLPKVKFSARVYTEMEDPEDSTKHIENEEKLHASDLLKIEMRIEYEDLAMEDMEGYVWSRNFPYLKRHGWNIMMVDAKTGERVVMNEHKVRFEDKFAKPGKDDSFKVYDGSIYHIFKQRFGQAGSFEFKCHFISDSYIGLDGECPIVIKTVPDPTDAKEPQYSKEDKKAVEGNSQIASLFAQEEDGFSASESEGEEGDEPTEKLSQTEKLKKRLEEANLGSTLSGRSGSGVSKPKPWTTTA